MASTTSARQQPCMDRLDAAQALLGVSPATFEIHDQEQPSLMTMPSTSSTRAEQKSVTIGKNLDALATLASTAHTMEPRHGILHSLSHSVSSSSDDDSEAMPPPPPRRRMRSVSNPEGMEKWDSLSQSHYSRRHFVLPSSILEEELAEARSNAAERAREEDDAAAIMIIRQLRLKKRNKSFDIFGTSPNSVISPIMVSTDRSDDESLSPVDEVDIAPEELLRRARSRLLEDLSAGSLTGEKGVLTLPHSLNKYKEVRTVFLRSGYEGKKTEQCYLYCIVSLFPIHWDSFYRCTTKTVGLVFTLLLSVLLLLPSLP